MAIAIPIPMGARTGKVEPGRIQEAGNMLDSNLSGEWMSSKQSRILCIVILLVLAAWLVSPLLLSFHEQSPPVSTEPLVFNGQEAYRVIEDFVVKFPIRLFGSLESRQSTGYLLDRLAELGYSTSFFHFDGRIATRKQVGRNVLGYKQGGRPEILALVAHLDTTKTTVQGAMDNGSGVGVLLELARIFAAAHTNHSLLIAFTDGEEWGMLGAGDLVRNYPERSRIIAVVSLDYVSVGDLAALWLVETGQLEGFTPPWLREIARSAIKTEALPVRGPSGFLEYLERAFLISSADQGPFLRAGIPAVNLWSESKDRAREQEIYHSAQDTINNLKPDSIGIYGTAAERLVRSLDQMPSIPRQSSKAFRLWDGRYLKPAAISALQAISFLPLALVLWFHLKNFRKQLTPARMGREFMAFLGTLLPLWIIYFFIAVCRAARLIPVYSLYPPPVKDPVLENPPWGTLAGIFGAALLVAVVCCIVAIYYFRNLPKPDLNVSKTALLGLLLICVVLGLIYNPYWASLFLLLPAWIWALAGKKPAVNRILIVAAGIPYFAVLGMYGSGLHMGWKLVWYHVLALSNGLFTQSAYLLATAVIAIGIRFLVIQSHQVANGISAGASGSSPSA